MKSYEIIQELHQDTRKERETEIKGEGKLVTFMRAVSSHLG